MNIPTDISSQAISTISINKDYVKVYPLTTDATPLHYNSILPDRIGNNSLNSTLIQQENIKGTRNLTQQDFQTPSHFANEEVVKTVTTNQQSISPIHPNLTTPRHKNPTLPQVTLQSTVKPSVVPKYSQMDYQTFRPMTKPTHEQRTFTRNSFAEHNYNYINRRQTNKPPRIKTQNHLFSQRQNSQQPTSNSVNFNDNPRISQDQMPNAAESLQMIMNPYLMGGSSITSNKPLTVFTGTDPEYSIEDKLKAVTANLILNIGPINTPLHQNWIHRRTALIQTTLDGAAQKWFSVLPTDVKSDWKRFTQEFSKMFDSERNKQHQRVLCNEIRRLPNEMIKQLAVRIETLVLKAYSLNTHDCKKTQK